MIIAYLKRMTLLFSFLVFTVVMSCALNPDSDTSVRQVRVQVGDGVYSGLIEGDDVHITDTLYQSQRDSAFRSEVLPLLSAQLLKPLVPRSVLGIHHTGHAPFYGPPTELGFYVPAPPDLYGRFPSSLADPGASIEIPSDAGRVVATPQLVIAIGQEAAMLNPEQVDDVVLGCMLGIDLLEADAYDTRGWVMARAADGWAPVGPWLVRGMPHRPIEFSLELSGNETLSYSMQDPADMVRLWVSRISRVITLRAGDLLFMGVSPEVAAMAPEVVPGQTMVARGTGLGELVNHTVAGKALPVLALRDPVPPDDPRTLDPGEHHFEAWQPVVAPKIFCVVRNFTRNDSPPSVNLLEELHDRIRLKMPNSMGGKHTDIPILADAGKLNWEGELVVVIGRQGRHLSAREAWDHIAGYTVGNDVSENHWGGLFEKSGDGWAVLGDTLVVGSDWRQWHLETWNNGELVQQGSMSAYRYSPAEIISYLSRRITLDAGDLIYLGTIPRVPGTRQAMQAGDDVLVIIPGLGQVRNRVVAK